MAVVREQLFRSFALFFWCCTVRSVAILLCECYDRNVDVNTQTKKPLLWRGGVAFFIGLEICLAMRK